ncbi:hypothetical protein PIB30_068037 [Stylosanthes scabra]|uniref:Uncharacterized protein n=1 Tax=Stylosanthes scabra TaxID=79078 RepID=A0ABU6UM93_9FABA|nr:hypothetical protein [Stylosanthes scabra]
MEKMKHQPLLSTVNGAEKNGGKDAKLNTKKMKHPLPRGVPIVQRKESRGTTHYWSRSAVVDLWWRTAPHLEEGNMLSFIGIAIVCDGESIEKKNNYNNSVNDA